MVDQQTVLQLAAAMSDTPAPIYQRVKQAIVNQIRAGHWLPHQRVPSESELVAELGVSRMTINRALRELTDEGRLVRLQGVGTFVAPPKAQSALFEIHSIAAEVESRGHRHRCRVLSAESTAATAELAAALDIAPQSPVFHTRMVHYEDDAAIQYEERWVNPAVAPHYLDQDFERHTAHDYLSAVAPFSEGEHVVEALLPPKAVAEALAMHKGEPCLVIQRRTWSGGKVVTFVRLWFPADRYRLVGRFFA